MKDYLILKDFTGTQDSIAPGELFTAGSVRPVSDSLAAALGGTNGGYIKDAAIAASDIAKAPPELAGAVLDAIADADDSTQAENREIKVVEPEETKPKTLTLKKK